jgi:transposase
MSPCCAKTGRLEELRTGDFVRYPSILKAKIRRELDRLELTLQQIKAVDTERNAMLSALALGEMLKNLKGMARNSPMSCGGRGCSAAFPTDGRLPLMPDWRRRPGGADPSRTTKPEPRATMIQLACAKQKRPAPPGSKRNCDGAQTEPPTSESSRQSLVKRGEGA